MNTKDLRAHLAAGGRALFDLSDRTKLQLTGADRVRYLNGQVSNDVRKAKPESALSACVMTAKGKMNALVWIAAGTDAIRIDSEAEQRESLAARLERYIISDDAELTDITDDFRLFHQIGGEAPMGAISSRRFGVDGYDIWLPASESADAVLAGALLVTPETAETFRIEQGIPKWGAELDENTLPPEARLDVGAIDYHKGCYIGQEVISRIKSVGHVNRRLCGFIADEPFIVGDSLVAREKDVGRITSAAWSFALDKAVALGYLRRGMEEATITIGSSTARTTQTIVAQDLPLFPQP